MNIIEMIKSKKFVVLGSIILVGIILIAGIVTSMDAFASEVYWDLKIGDKKVAVFNTEEEANKVIRQVKRAYVVKGSKVLSTKCDPAMTVEEATYKVSEKPELANVKEMVKYILNGTEEVRKYKVKENETLWDISIKNGFSVEELIKMNPDKDPELIFPGDVLNFYEQKPLVDVVTEQVITEEKYIQYKTIERKTSDLYEDESELKQMGQAGLKKVTSKVRMKNGRVLNSKVQKTKILKKAVKEIILVGSKERPVVTQQTTSTSNSNSGYTPSYDYNDGSTYSGNGSAVASFALQYVGGPYVYGGSSLTNGADCSGFVMAVFNNFGVSLPHGAIPMRYYGRGVSLSEAMPGDIICNPGHVGIYIGGGQMVHALNEYAGITVTSVDIAGPVVAVRRIVE